MDRVQLFRNIVIIVSVTCIFTSQIIVLPILVFLFLFLLKVGNRELKIDRFDILFYIFIFFALISSLLAKNPSISLSAFFVIVIYYVVFAVSKNLNLAEEDEKLVIHAVLAITFIMTFFAVVQYIFPKLDFVLKVGDLKIINIPSSKSFSAYSSGLRPPSLTPNPVIFSTVVLYSIPLVIFYLIREKRKLLFLAAILAYILIGFLSGSRSMVIMFPVAIFFVFLIEKRFYQFFLVLVVITVFYYMAIYLIDDTLLRRSLDIFNRKDFASFNVRIDGYKKALEYLKDNWVFGIGIMNFSHLSQNFGNYIHNIYLSILVEMGVFSFMIFFSLLGFIVFELVKRLITNKSGNKVDIVVLSTVVTSFLFFIHNVFDNTIYVVSIGMIMWFLWGYSLRKVSS